jgi:hypothetical protein
MLKQNAKPFTGIGKKKTKQKQQNYTRLINFALL